LSDPSPTLQIPGDATSRDGHGAVPPGRSGAPARLRSSTWLDPVFRGVTASFAAVVLLFVAALGVVLWQKGHLALTTFGPSFLWSQQWDPVRGLFGALPSIYGTLVSSAIAIAIATPVGLGVAVFLVEMAPPWLARPVGLAIEMLAAIPSIIYGMWGLFVFAPFLSAHVLPAVKKLAGGSFLFAGPPMGIGMLPAALILAVMILPFIASIGRDVFALVPSVDKESAYGLGATTWEVVRNVVIPHTRTGLIGAIFLALGRALGETMAVTFVIGNAHNISASLLAPGSTIASTLANEFSEAVSEIHIASLIELGFILFLITTIILALAKLLLWRIESRIKGR
jgi:phosphate transport system permease protein